MKKSISRYSKMALIITIFSGGLQAKNLENIDVDVSVMVDHLTYDDAFLEDETDSVSNFELRRARLKLKGDILDNWKVKLHIAFEDDESEIKDARLTYKGWDFADINFGRQKEPYGLERLMGGSDLLLTERSMMSGSLTPNRSTGILAEGDFKVSDSSDLYWQLGLFEPEDVDSGSAVTGRLAYVPWYDENNLFQAGFSFSERDLDDSEFRINEKFEVFGSDSLIEGEQFFADSSSLQAVELLWQHKGITGIAEWSQETVEDVYGLEYDYDGGYVQVGYLLSNQNRAFKNGVLGGVERSDEWEATMRYSKFSLDTEEIKTESYSVGLSYYVNKDIKFMVNYLNAKYYENNEELDSGDAYSLRVQFAF